MPKCRLFRTKRKRRKKLARKRRKTLATRKENSLKQVTPIPQVRVIEYTIARNKPINQKKITIHSVFVLRNSATSFSNSFTFSTSTMLISSSVYHSILSLRLYVDSLLQLVRFRLEIRGQRGEKSLHRQPKSLFHAFDFAVEKKLLSEGCFHQTCEL